MENPAHTRSGSPAPLARLLALGLMSFGGGGEQARRLASALTARGLATRDEAEQGLSLCRQLPGWLPHQLAVFLGWRRGGCLGGALAGAALLLPAALVMALLCWLAAAFSGLPAVAGALRALSGVALAILARAAWRQGRRALTHPVFYGFAAGALLMEWALRLKFYGVVIVAVLMGLWLGQARPDIFGLKAEASLPRPESRGGSWRGRAGRIALGGVAAWLVIGLPVLLYSGEGALLPRMLNFFTRAGFFAFGGAYGQLSFFADMAGRLSWLEQGKLAQGLGLCVAAPAAAFPVAQWAGFTACLGHPGGLDPLLAGTLGGLLAVFGLHLPGTLLILACAPHADACAANRWLRAANAGVGAAMVGVIVKLLLVLGAAALWPGGLVAAGPGATDRVALAGALVMGLGLWRGRVPIPALAAAIALAGAASTLLG